MSLFNFPQIDSNVNVVFSVDGDEYEVNQFRIGFHQPVDANKNQPEGEVRGGRIMIYFLHHVPDILHGCIHGSLGHDQLADSFAKVGQLFGTL